MNVLKVRIRVQTIDEQPFSESTRSLSWDPFKAPFSSTVLCVHRVAQVKPRSDEKVSLFSLLDLIPLL